MSMTGWRSVRHEHDGLEAARLAGPGQAEVVGHEAGVDLALVHRAWVHVGRLLHHHLQLLACKCKRKAAKDDRVEESNDGQDEGPADTAAAELEVVRLGPAHPPHLVIVPAGGEGG